MEHKIETTIAVYPLPMLSYKNAALQIKTISKQVPDLDEDLQLTEFLPERGNLPAWLSPDGGPITMQAATDTTGMQISFQYYLRYSGLDNKNIYKHLNIYVTEISYDANTIFLNEGDNAIEVNDMIPEIIDCWTELSQSQVFNAEAAYKKPKLNWTQRNWNILPN